MYHPVPVISVCVSVFGFNVFSVYLLSCLRFLLIWAHVSSRLISLASWFARRTQGPHTWFLREGHLSSQSRAGIFHRPWTWRAVGASTPVSGQAGFCQKRLFLPKTRSRKLYLRLYSCLKCLSVAFIIDDKKTGYCILRSHFLSSQSLSTAFCCPLAEKVGIWLPFPSSACLGRWLVCTLNSWRSSSSLLDVY